MTLDKSHLIHVVLYWIDQALTAASPDIVAPQLSRRPPHTGARDGDIDDVPQQDKGAVEDTVTTASFLDLHEERRARSYEELQRLWAQIMPEARVAKTRAVERILYVDWPYGISFAMAATVAFEASRANLLGRNWTAMSLDFGESRSDEGSGKDSRASNGTSAQHLERLKYISPESFVDDFSRELQHYCSHAIFIDKPVEDKVPAGTRLEDTDALTPLPDNWAKPFTHIRVVTCENATEICSVGLHVLHLPQSAWCLVSGNMGRSSTEVREMALNALANAMGARRMRMPQSKQPGSNKTVKSGRLGELRGRDPLALREILVSEGLVEDTSGFAEQVPGGKGRLMRRKEAEEGPLVRPEKRCREDKSGLYADVNGVSKPDGDNAGEVMDLREHRTRTRQRNARERARQREVDDLFGKAVNITDDSDLPRVEKMQYDLYLPFAADENGDSVIPEDKIQAHPITLRLEGTHVLAGLRKLVASGLERPARQQGRVEADNRAADDATPSGGLPQWLVEVRGTRVRVGASAMLVDDSDDGASEAEDGSPSVEPGREGESTEPA